MNNEERLMPIFKALYDKVVANDLVQNKYCDNPSGTTTVELLAPRIELDPMQPVLVFPGRKTPEKYVKAELDWYDSQDLSVDVIGEKAKIWKQIASDEGKVNSNYGWCIYSEDNYSQYQQCVEELKKSPDSRRACMIYQRPSMWEDYKYRGMSDFICTWGAHVFIRGNQLQYIVLQRSMDAIFGFFNDFAWHCEVYARLLTDLKESYPDLTVGSIIYIPDTMHVYERHFDTLKQMVEGS